VGVGKAEVLKYWIPGCRAQILLVKAVMLYGHLTVHQGLMSLVCNLTCLQWTRIKTIAFVEPPAVLK
jgi:hypothetical protein